MDVEKVPWKWSVVLSLSGLYLDALTKWVQLSQWAQMMDFAKGYWKEKDEL